MLILACGLSVGENDDEVMKMRVLVQYLLTTEKLHAVTGGFVPVFKKLGIYLQGPSNHYQVVV